MREWQKIRLGDVATDVTVGFVGSMAAEYRDTGVPFLRSLNVRPHRIDLTNVRFIDTGFHQRLRKSTLRPGDVVTVRTGKPGQSAVIPDWLAEANCSDLVITRPGPELSARWLSYYLNWITDSHIASHLVGAVQQHFNVKSAQSIVLTLPPLTVQNAIADTLSALDHKIAANERQLLLAGQLTSSIFARAAADGYRDRIDRVASLVTRGATPTYVESDGLIVLNQKCVRDQWVNLQPGRLTDPARARPDRMLTRNDVLVNSTGYGTLGRTARWTYRDVQATVDTHITIVRFDESLVDPVCAGFAALELEDQIESLAQGSTGQTELSRNLLGGLELLIPRKDAQPDLGRRLQEFDDLALTLRAESSRLAAARDELLPLLMSGKIRVRGAEKIVEEVT